MIDLLFLTWNRKEFTAECIAALQANTDWKLVRRVWIYDDGSTDGTLEMLRPAEWPVPTFIVQTSLRSPVASMNDFLQKRGPAEVFCKLDNDTMVPPGWLGEASELLAANPTVDLLGIEARDGLPCSAAGPRAVQGAKFIGGIGLMRRRAFERHGLPGHDGRFGFGAWQERNEVPVGWIVPTLPVFLLNRLPLEPWASYSRRYVAQGWQRDWPEPYSTEVEKWAWWK